MLIAAVVATPLLGVIALDDARHRLVRNRHILSVAAVVVAGVAVSAVVDGRAVVIGAAGGALLGSVPLLVPALVQPERIGGGDVKLAAVVGALLGAIQLWLSIAAVGAALVATLAVGLVRSHRRIPLAPGLVMFALVAVGIAAAGVA